MSRLSPLFAAKAGIARMIGRASRLSGRGSGTTLPGRALLKMAPDALDRLSGRLNGAVTVISATNGKTTTASMLATVLAGQGRRPVHNHAGSNMTWGVATALLEQRGDEGLFEVDEAWLPEVAARLHPETILLGNLFRDQLDRYGETEALADAWIKLAAESPRTVFVLNADDPLVAGIGDHAGADPVYYGVEDPTQALAQVAHAHDARHCRSCGSELSYAHAFIGHLGHYRCDSCGLERPRPDVFADQITLHGMDGLSARIVSPEETAELHLPLPGLYNLYNALAALAAARQLGVPLVAAAASLADMKAVFGRVEKVEIGNVSLSILLVKNPTGANEVLRTLALEPAPINLLIALNDKIADGRDVSWIWDADFEVLAGRVGTVTCAGTRAAEMALRLKYAGWPVEKIEVVGDIDLALDEAVERASGGRLFALPTYTALLQLRAALAGRGLVERRWDR